MPIRTITVRGKRWEVLPSQHVTSYARDEFALIFRAGEGAESEVRVTRYSPQASRWRDQTLED